MITINWVSDTTLTQVVLLCIAFVLSAIVGLERQRQLKSAGLRTHTIVGLGAAVFTLVSAYGFDNVLGSEVQLDPSRIAAQIVSGIGFLGAGVIFVRQNVVNGLTTAASIWVTAAIGMACGAGMPVVAALATALYLVAVTALSLVSKKLPAAHTGVRYVVRYRNSRGALRRILAEATRLGYEISLGDSHKTESGDGDVIEMQLRFTHPKKGPDETLYEKLADTEDVLSVQTPDDND
ncbi:putative Mg2+ transporter-C (MgtC) family protein [Paramicrobacterium humi]|uniref:Putative Mg2+ transporter-C (MgtC) family protein n=1 Tax=Paramicrobacterium humi TaxID=640635 RepID=A0A1H4NI81_9MICO|nr:MgtC/SapB family protein [Microbacterium humi]SEB94814.1 putative Mg2+ transporter-C (MgtC) family protein [Microbacterium humi]